VVLKGFVEVQYLIAGSLLLGTKTACVPGSIFSPDYAFLLKLSE